MSVPMPVMTRIITAASGSRRSSNGMFSRPETIHEYTTSLIERTPPTGSRWSKRQTAAADQPNESAIAPTATAAETVLDRRRPNVALTTNPASGRSGIRYSTRSPSERRKCVRVQRFLVPEQGDDDRQTGGRFGGRDGHDEEHDDLPVHRPEVAIDRDERQVDGVEHHLDREQDRDQVPAEEHARRADRKQHGREDEVAVERRLRHPAHARSLRARMIAPTIATRISTEVASNANE